MATKTLDCAKCGKPALVNVPDDGTATAWECPDYECSARNEVEGTAAVHDIVVAPGERDDAQVLDPAESVVEVADGDSASAGDTHA